MPLRDPGLWLETKLHTGEILRMQQAAMFGSSVGLFAGGVGATNPAHGVVATGDLAVSANGTPNLTVNVAPGAFFIHGTESATQGAYFNINDGVENVTGVPTGNGSNPTWHLLIVQARNASGGFSGSDTDFRFTIVPGTPAASPADPSLALYPNALVLARIVMPTGATNVGGGVGQGTIVDLRPRAGNQFNCTSTTLPAVAAKGQRAWCTDTGKELVYYGTVTGWQPPWGDDWGRLYYAKKTTGGTGLTSYTLFTTTQALLGDRIYRVTTKIDSASDTSIATGEAMSFEIRDGATMIGRDVTKSIEANVGTSLRAEAILEPATGNKTLTIVLASTIGNNIAYSASTTAPAWLLIEDIGPATPTAPTN